MKIMPVADWTAFKALMALKGFNHQYIEFPLYYEVSATEAGIYLWETVIMKGTSDETDFVNNYKSSANKPAINNSAVLSIAPIGSKKIIVAGATKNLFARFTGIKQTVNNGINTISYTIPYAWVKIVGVEVVNCTELDTADLEVYDDANGSYSGIPNLKLNQFSYSLNLPSGYYTRMAQFDADIYQNMVIKIQYNSAAVLAKTVGINILMNEVKSP